MDRLTVLLAEDTRPIRQLLGCTLRQEGYHVLEACDGFHALTTASKFDGGIDALVSDVTMPRMNGDELARRLRLERPGIRVVLISGYSRSTIAVECDAFLQKPFTPNAFIECVRHVLRVQPKCCPAAPLARAAS